MTPSTNPAPRRMALGDYIGGRPYLGQCPCGREDGASQIVGRKRKAA